LTTSQHLPTILEVHLAMASYAPHFVKVYALTNSPADLLHASQGNGGGDIEGNGALENIINEIMQKLTGNVSTSI
jgi:hypothetical protein